MILVVIFAIWMALVVVTVTIDVVTGIFEERPPKTPKSKGKKSTWKADMGDQKVKKGIAAYRNLKKIEFGLNMVSKREVRVDRPSGAHRRLQVS